MNTYEFPYPPIWSPAGDTPGLLCGLSTWEDSPGSPVETYKILHNLYNRNFNLKLLKFAQTPP